MHVNPEIPKKKKGDGWLRTGEISQWSANGTLSYQLVHVSLPQIHPTHLIFRLKNLIELTNGEVSEDLIDPTFTDLSIPNYFIVLDILRLYTNPATSHLDHPCTHAASPQAKTNGYHHPEPVSPPTRSRSQRH